MTIAANTLTASATEIHLRPVTWEDRFPVFWSWVNEVESEELASSRRANAGLGAFEKIL
jgi:hypothetical protein